MMSTPYAAVVRTAQVHLGNAVGVWGVGGVGSHLVQLAKLAGGVPIIAVDIDDAVLARATRLGADYTFRSDDPQLGRNPLLPRSIRFSAWLTLHMPRLWQWACRNFLKDRQ